MNIIKSKLRHAGFSLIEVIIAISVISGGLLVIIAVFPGALRLGASATADTRQTAFAENVLGTIKMKAATVTDYNNWKNETGFWNTVGYYIDKDGNETGLLPPGIPHDLDGYFVKDEKASYLIRIKQAPLDATIWNIAVYCSDTPDIRAENCTPYQLSVRFRHPVP